MSVNIHDEWTKLEEIVVGSVFNYTEHNVDLSFKLFFNDNIKDVFVKNSVKIQQKILKEREEDLNELADVLKKHGVTVHRPKTLELVAPFETPYFKDHLSPCDNPRDQVLIIGNKIIETPCVWRKRYFENDLLKDIFYQKFMAGADWISAPRPMMKDESFDLEYAKKSSNKNIDWTYYDGLDKKYEIMFDAAQCIKIGKDIIMNVANKNHELGLQWLARTIGEEYRIHPVKLTDYHIDSTIMPLAPGTLLVNANLGEKIREHLPAFLKNWKIITVPVLANENYELNLASSNIYTNVLSIDEKTILTFSEKGEEDFPLKMLLEKNGFNCINLKLRHSRLFSGGLHCVTLDLKRQGKLEDYSK